MVVLEHAVEESVAVDELVFEDEPNVEGKSDEERHMSCNVKAQGDVVEVAVIRDECREVRSRRRKRELRRRPSLPPFLKDGMAIMRKYSTCSTRCSYRRSNEVKVEAQAGSGVSEAPGEPEQSQQQHGGAQGHVHSKKPFLGESRDRLVVVVIDSRQEVADPGTEST